MAARNQAGSNEHVELRILRRKKVEIKTGISRSSIYDGIKRGTFPKPIQLGQQSVGWLESEIDAWLRERIAASRAPSAV
jgi:prophage regulatory protein